MPLSAMKVSGSTTRMGAKPLSDGITCQGVSQSEGSDIERFYYNENFVEIDSNKLFAKFLSPFARFSCSDVYMIYNETTVRQFNK